ncbi:MAG TPA: class I SAM-dependent methyltransferase [Planctomycetes bacterium]|nr:class I SAM-dependent methyltransferase [Planctomycetota bacterium]
MADSIERRVQEAWCDAQGIDVVDCIHPEDEMYLLNDSMRPEGPRRRAEYMRTGYEPVLVLDHVLAHSGRTWADIGRLLEFACGFGRTTRFLIQRVPAERIVSSDLLPGSVEWVTDRFGVSGLPSSPDPEKLELGGPFDLIYVGSLFSHLPRGRFEAFLRSLFEALTPEGLLVFTTHGADKIESMPKDPSGFTFHRESESRSLDVDEYGSTFVAPRVMAEIASGLGIRHIARVDRHLWACQDVWFASRTPLPVFPEDAPIIRGGILRADVDTNGHGWVGGFTMVPADAGPVQRVRLRVGDSGFDALLSPPKALPSGEPMLHQEWYLEGSLSFLEPGLHPLTATALGTKGPAICIGARELDVPAN